MSPSDQTPRDTKAPLTKAECRPGSAKATKWGAWSATEAAADKAAFVAARSAAGQACHGDGCGTGKTCSYTETTAELLESEDRTNDTGQTSYRSKVKSEGKCECQ